MVVVALPVVPVVAVVVVIVGLVGDGLPLAGGVEVGLDLIVEGGADVSLVGDTGAVGGETTAGLTITTVTPRLWIPSRAQAARSQPTSRACAHRSAQVQAVSRGQCIT